MKFTDADLAQIALAAARNSHSPYSHSKVGAALIAGNEIFSGTNVENRSYGLTVCAERVAVFKAVAAGKRKFTKIAVASSREEFITPCGACRQVLSEFCRDLKVLLVNSKGQIRRTTFKKLYPMPYAPKK